MSLKTIILVSAILITLNINIALSHHGFAAYSQSSITLKGTVSNFRFVNPHVQVYFDVLNEGGQIEKWQGELTAPNRLARGGMTKNTFQVGDVIILTGNIPNNGALSLKIRSITRETGEVIPIDYILEDL